MTTSDNVIYIYKPSESVRPSTVQKLLQTERLLNELDRRLPL
jgi:hypothetical protein